MGLGDELDKLAEEEENSSSSSGNSGSSGGSSSSSGSGYPKQKYKVPYLAVWQEEDGSYHSGFRPETLVIEYEKSSKSAKWELNAVPAEVERYWMDKSEIDRLEGMVEEELGLDVRELLDDDPKAALDAIQRAAKSNSPKRQPSRTRPCGVCGTDLDYVGGEYENVNGKRVCSNHTVADLAHAGLLED